MRKNWKSARKKGLHPFSPGVAPMDDPAISRRVWDAWYELYNEQGRTKWPKRFDFTQFRTAEVHYYSDAGERGDLVRTVVMCYSARANPEDIKKASGFKVREVRGAASGGLTGRGVVSGSGSVEVSLIVTDFRLIRSAALL